jgi:hypothetical protein
MRMPAALWRFVTVAAVALVASAFHVPAMDAQSAEREEFRAFAVNMGTAFGAGGAGGQSGVVEITIERWSTPPERQELITAFTEKGPDGLLRALQRQPRMGFIRTPNSLGWELRYTRQVPGEDGGRRILIATDRPIGFAEARNQPRTIDYPFTLIEMRLNKDNKGEGKMAVATKIALSRDKQHIELENYGTEPVRLTSIEKR